MHFSLLHFKFLFSKFFNGFIVYEKTDTEPNFQAHLEAFDSNSSMVICIWIIILTVIDINDLTPMNSLSTPTTIANFWNIACFWLSRFSVVLVVVLVVVVVVAVVVAVVVVVVVVRFTVEVVVVCLVVVFVVALVVGFIVVDFKVGLAVVLLVVVTGRTVGWV